MENGSLKPKLWGEFMKYLSKGDIEKIAERVISAYMNLPDIKDKRIYFINPEKLLTDLLKVKLEFHHLSLDGTVLGLTASSENYALLYDVSDTPFYRYIDNDVVFVEIEMKNDISQLGRYNFTVSHEASHKILQMLFPEEYCKTPFRGELHYSKAVLKDTDENTKWTEWQANALASALLMPRFLIEQAMYITGWNKNTKIINKIYFPKEYKAFAYMSELLGVSKEALGYRLVELGYIKKLFLRNEYSMIDIECGE